MAVETPSEQRPPSPEIFIQISLPLTIVLKSFKDCSTISGVSRSSSLAFSLKYSSPSSKSIFRTKLPIFRQGASVFHLESATRSASCLPSCSISLRACYSPGKTGFYLLGMQDKQQVRIYRRWIIFLPSFFFFLFFFFLNDSFTGIILYRRVFRSDSCDSISTMNRVIVFLRFVYRPRCLRVLRLRSLSLDTQDTGIGRKYCSPFVARFFSIRSSDFWPDRVLFQVLLVATNLKSKLFEMFYFFFFGKNRRVLVNFSLIENNPQGKYKYLRKWK